MKAVIATTTLYNPSDVVRMQLAIRTIQEATEEGYQIVVADGSPKSVKETFRNLGAIVINSTSGMGASRRQAIQIAAQLAGPDGIVIWMEPEKYPLVCHLNFLIETLIAEKADMVISERQSLESYPEMQQHFERLGNQLFKLLTGADLDVWFGPRVFRTDISQFFLDYDGRYGDLWDSIFIPVSRAILAGKTVIGALVNYHHPEEQTSAEDDLAMFRKRLKQLNVLSEALLTDASRPI